MSTKKKRQSSAPAKKDIQKKSTKATEPKNSKKAKNPKKQAEREYLWDAQRLRSLWKEYFKERKHTVTASASLLPSEDPSLLFTSAGMVPFKDYFSGRSQAPSARTLSIQKCLRTTDLDSVGVTDRHCSFFEMLGNFSFGDYFKREAIQYAWDFSLHHLKLDPQRIYVTVYHEDSESEKIWKEEIGVDPKHIKALGKEDNWWGPAGEQGPCGPCSELYLDRGEEICKRCRCENKDDCAPGAAGERFMEYWNLVFNEFYSDPQGKLHPLPQKGIDTGAGLERILALLENKESIYDTAEMQKIIHAFEELSAKLRSDGKKILYHSTNKVAFRVLSDHLRSVTFSIADGIFPANTGRGYVVRRIIRRALLYARELGIFVPLLHELVALIVEIYGEAYPELKARQTDVQERLLAEEGRFLETLELGLKQWQELLEQHQEAKQRVFAGRAAFLLYDTYGFPLELTSELAEKAKLKLDLKTFNQEMEKQRLRSTKASQWKGIALPALKLRAGKFLGYEKYSCQSKVLGIVDVKKGQSILSCSIKDFEGHSIIVILDQTPFYAEGGGQLGDKGQLLGLDAEGAMIFAVEDTQKSGSLILHIGQLKSGKLEVGTRLQASIDQEWRKGLMHHHSATHLLNKSLRNILGEHVLQTGSLVAPNYLRFDFSHSEKISNEALSKISGEVNAAIQANGKVSAKTMSLAGARQTGAIATFGEKYGQEVRVLSMGSEGELSKELCGGCHVKNTAEIGFFHIVKESSPGAGNRRIEAIAGEQVREYFQNELQQLKTDIHKHNQDLKEIAKTLKEEQTKQELLALEIDPKLLPRATELLTKPEQVCLLKDNISRIKAKWEQARKQKIKLVKKHSAQSLVSEVDNYLAQIQKLGPIQLLSLELAEQDPAKVRQFADKIKEKSRGIVILLGIVQQGKCSLLFSADKQALERARGLSMAELIRESANHIGGSGGGRSDMAQAGGKNAAGLQDALRHAQKRIKDFL